MNCRFSRAREQLTRNHGDTKNLSQGSIRTGVSARIAEDDHDQLPLPIRTKLPFPLGTVVYRLDYPRWRTEFTERLSVLTLGQVVWGPFVVAARVRRLSLRVAVRDFFANSEATHRSTMLRMFLRVVTPCVATHIITLRHFINKKGWSRIKRHHAGRRPARSRP